jgi:hypothetical protein
VATAKSKTETIERTTVTLTLTEEEAFVVHALVSNAEELDSDHPLHNGSREVFLALDGLLAGGDTYDRRMKLYNSVRVDEMGCSW